MMSDLSAFHGPNAGYVLDLYDRYLQIRTASIPTRERCSTGSIRSRSRRSPRHEPRRGRPPVATSAPTGPIYDVSAVVGAAALAQAIRDYGHLDVQLDPLGTPPHGAPELHPTFHGITEAELAALPVESVPWPVSPDAAQRQGGHRRPAPHLQRRHRLRLRPGPDRRRARLAARGGRERPVRRRLSPEAKKKLLERLTEVEGFERFLHQTYLGQKRFSIEGTDALVPMLDEIIRDAAAAGTREVVIGMAHRGRLNVLTHVLGKPYAAIIAAFEGSMARSASPSDSSSDNGVTGDVKYHLGARRARAADGGRSRCRWCSRRTRATSSSSTRSSRGWCAPRRTITTSPGRRRRIANRAMAILLHGDAAFPGQGIVAETLNLSGLPGYSTGGTIHIIVNNQVGFTTDPRFALDPLRQRPGQGLRDPGRPRQRRRSRRLPRRGAAGDRLPAASSARTS